jgi:hypothetical protein
VEVKPKTWSATGALVTTRLHALSLLNEYVTLKDAQSSYQWIKITQLVFRCSNTHTVIVLVTMLKCFIDLDQHDVRPASQQGCERVIHRLSGLTLLWTDLLPCGKKPAQFTGKTDRFTEPGSHWFCKPCIHDGNWRALLLPSMQATTSLRAAILLKTNIRILLRKYFAWQIYLCSFHKSLFGCISDFGDGVNQSCLVEGIENTGCMTW